ncbi:MAG TPA: M20/M25/M40 family metallo-hydrolase [Cyclobacteriaceae bacterium]|nr:M20/M25/M40 family metallo-hydrolase [Cyclobacteriaceae bacterium]
MRTLFTLSLVVFLAIAGNAQKQKDKVDFKVDYDKEIEKIAKNKSIQQAFNVIDELEPQTMKDLILLTEIPAPPFMEEKRGLQFKKMLEEAGADKVWIDEVGNVIALRKGKTGGGVVALDAHLDTVFPEGTDVTVKISGDTLKAPGIGDDTRGLAVVIAVLRALEKASVETTADVLLIGSVGEEGLGDLRGVKHLFEKGDLKIDSWISIDGGEIGRMATGGLGSIRYKATFKGPGGHSWGAFGLANPHHALGKAIYIFSEEASKFTATGSKVSFNVGRIGGGTSVNSIPFESWMEVDMRSVDPERLKTIDEIFKASMNKGLEEYNKGVKKGDPLTLDLEVIGLRPSGFQKDELAVIQRSMAAAKYFNAEISTSPGSTNSNIPISLGIPSVTIGRGGIGGGAHSLHEWWMNKDGAEAIKFALLLTVAEAGMAK